VADPPVLTNALLEELAVRWREHDAAVARRLMAGLSDAEIDELVEPLGLRVPSEARTWWRWHNGARDAFIVHTGGKAFSSLARCVQIASTMRDIARQVTAPYRLSESEANEMARRVWNWDWLPLCDDGVGGIAVVRAGAEDAPQAVSPVLYRDRDAGSNAIPLAPSIGALVHQWITILDAGAGSYDRRRDRWVLVPEKLPPGYDERIL
jgi:cell wall assembly regulator SMI1